jgi:hypothetical protein
MKNSRLLAIPFLLLLLVSCSMSTGPILTPLEKQALQTREYEDNYDIVFASTISVFQDLGYTINNADKATGLISGSSPTKTSGWLQKVLTSRTNRTNTRASAFIETIGKMTKIRISFVLSDKSSSVYGQEDQNDVPLYDAVIYRNAFEQIENAIFVRSSAQE